MAARLKLKAEQPNAEVIVLSLRWGDGNSGAAGRPEDPGEVAPALVMDGKGSRREGDESSVWASGELVVSPTS